MRSRVVLCRAAILVPVLVVLIVAVAPAAERNEIGYPRIMQGPMVGAVSEHGARIWLRLSRCGSISLLKGPLGPGSSNSSTVNPAALNARQ